jgi:hypothetical protein
MFGPITLPFGAKMLFNTVNLKPGVSFEDVEMAVGEMCMVVKETYWDSFEAHERSHADRLFMEKFSALALMCSNTKELGYDMLWQGAPRENG